MSDEKITRQRYMVTLECNRPDGRIVVDCIELFAENPDDVCWQVSQRMEGEKLPQSQRDAIYVKRITLATRNPKPFTPIDCGMGLPDAESYPGEFYADGADDEEYPPSFENGGF